MFKRKGGGSKAFWTMLKKTALFLKDGFPKSQQGFYCTKVRSLSTLVTDWLTIVIETNWLMWPWRCKLNTCWCCYCCWCWWWGRCWQQFARDFDAEYCSRYRGWGLVNMLKLKFSWDFEAEVWSRFWSWILTNMWHGLIKSGYFVKVCTPWVHFAFGNVWIDSRLKANFKASKPSAIFSKWIWF